jgi:glutamate-ammonia-ligase adenylyltransferase
MTVRLRVQTEHGKLTNREYFIKVSGNCYPLVGQPVGEGAAYRVDLRLRPHGRDGALACSLDEALKYYRKSGPGMGTSGLDSQPGAAGFQHTVFPGLPAPPKTAFYRPDVSIKEALASVRTAKLKIDRNIERKSEGFNVKLQRGGIREIEFIAQALQLAYGGRDEWLRVYHTLISLGRLADRNLISVQERSELFDAYVFLRTLEHRLQMEHGLQTHTVPQTDLLRTSGSPAHGFSQRHGTRGF